MWNEEGIREKMKTSKKWLGRGLIAIYQRQTADEQMAEQTVYRNDVGFNGADAHFLSSLARQLIDKGDLSDKQWQCARKSMLKYAGQLARIANGEIA